LPLTRLSLPACPPLSVFLLLVGACAAPGPTPGFHDLQAEQTAIQAALNDPKDGVPHAWQGSGGTQGTATALGPADEPGCRRLRTDGTGGTDEDVWCPTPHGFWVHAEERFFRNATGQEKYGGPPRDRLSAPADGRTSAGASRPSQRDCLQYDRDSRDLMADGRTAQARAARRAFHACMHRAN